MKRAVSRKAGLAGLVMVMMLTAVFVFQAHADTTFDIAFSATDFTSSFNDVSGEFIVAFDPASPSSGTFSMVSLTGLPSPATLTTYSYDPSGASNEGVLDLNFAAGTYSVSLSTYGYHLVPPGLSLGDLTIENGGGLVAVSFTGTVQAVPQAVPVPPGFILFGTGLLTLAGVRLRQVRAKG